MEQELYSSLVSLGILPLAAPGDKRGANWDLTTWIYLIHCAIDDRAGVELFKKHKSMNRAELDACRSVVAAVVFHQKVANLFNNETNHFMSISLDPSMSWKLAQSKGFSFADTIGEKVTAQSSESEGTASRPLHQFGCGKYSWLFVC
jgi:hypothetical protein